MLRNRVLELMESLKLTGMRAAYDEVLASATKTHASPEKIILALLETEQSERRLRAIRYQMSQAKFPFAKDLLRNSLHGFDGNQLETEGLSLE